MPNKLRKRFFAAMRSMSSARTASGSRFQVRDVPHTLPPEVGRIEGTPESKRTMTSPPIAWPQITELSCTLYVKVEVCGSSTQGNVLLGL